MRASKVSVITSIFNADKYISRFLRSCESQEGIGNIEFIFRVCRPSSFVRQRLREFQELGITTKVLISQKMENIYQSWNICLKETSGDYIAIWNVDDLRTTNSILLQSNLLDSTSHMSVGGEFVMVSEFGQVAGIKYSTKKISENDLFRSMLHGPFFMFKKEALTTLKGFDEQYTSAADFDFCIRLANLGSVGFVEENLGFYLNSGVGLSTRKSVQVACERESIYFRYSAFAKMDITLLGGLRKFNIDRVRIAGKKYELESVTKNLEEIHAANYQDITVRKWTINLLRRYLRELVSTLFFYIMHPKSKLCHYFGKH